MNHVFSGKLSCRTGRLYHPPLTQPPDLMVRFCGAVGTAGYCRRRSIPRPLSTKASRSIPFCRRPLPAEAATRAGRSSRSATRPHCRRCRAQRSFLTADRPLRFLSPARRWSRGAGILLTGGLQHVTTLEREADNFDRSFKYGLAATAPIVAIRPSRG